MSTFSKNKLVGANLWDGISSDMFRWLHINPIKISLASKLFFTTLLVFDCTAISLTTVKPVLSGHLRGMLWCPLNTGCPPNTGFDIFNNYSFQSR